jgi:hypothetical protein
MYTTAAQRRRKIFFVRPSREVSQLFGLCFAENLAAAHRPGSGKVRNSASPNRTRFRRFVEFELSSELLSCSGDMVMLARAPSLDHF